MKLAELFTALAPKPKTEVAQAFPVGELPPGWDMTARPTLGPLVIAWMAENLRDDSGEPFTPTAAQRRLICQLYQLRPDGRFRWRRLSLRRVKGFGKSPLLAALCLAELAGPVAFAGWDGDGHLRAGRRHSAWVVIAGVSEAGTRPIMQSVAALLVGSPLFGEGLDLGLTRVRFGAGLIQLATAGASSLEGIRPSFIVADETGHWTPGRHGHELWDVLARSAAKVPGSRLVDASNAHAPGEDSVAERLADAWHDMQDDDPDLIDVLYDDETAPPDLELSDLDAVRDALAWLYRDSPWIDLNALVAQMLDSSTKPAEYRRFFLNQSTSDSSRWTSAAAYDACADPSIAPLKPGDPLAIGIDPAMTRDSTAVVAVRITDGAPFLLWLGSAPLDTDDLNKAVADAFARYNVVALFSDVHGGEALLPLWRAKYGPQVAVRASAHDPIAYDHRANGKWVTRESERLRAEIDAGTFRWKPDAGSDLLRKHLLAAVAVDNEHGTHFAKPARGGQYKVDALAALLTARIARAFYLRSLSR